MEMDIVQSKAWWELPDIEGNRCPDWHCDLGGASCTISNIQDGCNIPNGKFAVITKASNKINNKILFH